MRLDPGRRIQRCLRWQRGLHSNFALRCGFAPPTKPACSLSSPDRGALSHLGCPCRVPAASWRKAGRTLGSPQKRRKEKESPSDARSSQLARPLSIIRRPSREAGTAFQFCKQIPSRGEAPLRCQTRGAGACSDAAGCCSAASTFQALIRGRWDDAAAAPPLLLHLRGAACSRLGRGPRVPAVHPLQHRRAGPRGPGAGSPLICRFLQKPALDLPSTSADPTASLTQYYPTLAARALRLLRVRLDPPRRRARHQPGLLHQVIPSKL